MKQSNAFCNEAIHMLTRAGITVSNRWSDADSDVSLLSADLRLVADDLKDYDASETGQAYSAMVELKTRIGGLENATCAVCESQNVHGKVPEFQVGDKVAYSVQFLKSCGMSHGEAAHARGTITGIQALGSHFVLASIDWNGADMPGRVNVFNLARVGPNPRFCNVD